MTADTAHPAAFGLDADERAELELVAAYLYRDERDWHRDAAWHLAPDATRATYLRRARTIAAMLGWPYRDRMLRHLDRLCPCDPNPETTEGPLRECPLHGEQPDAVIAVQRAVRDVEQLRGAAENALAHTGGEQDGYVLVQAEYVESLRRCVRESWGFGSSSTDGDTR